MSLKLLIAPQARSDIKEVRDYVARYNKDTAKAFNAQIAGTFASLCDMPMMGRQRDELKVGMRSFVVGKYIIFYQLLSNNRLEIVRVLHNARDISHSSTKPKTKARLFSKRAFLL